MENEFDNQIEWEVKEEKISKNNQGFVHPLILAVITLVVEGTSLLYVIAHI